MYFSPNPNATSIFTSQLQLATIDPATGNMTVLSSTMLSPDGFSMGDCDIDPVNNRYFYVRANTLYSVDLTTGNLISTKSIQNPNNAIAPITSIAYDDFKISQIPTATMDMGDTIYIGMGENLLLDGYTSNNVTYLWQDGSTNSSFMVQDTGTYELTISRDAFSAKGKVTVLRNETSTSIKNQFNELNIKVFPNPTNDFLNYEISEGSNTEVIIFNTLGQAVKSFANLNPQGQLDLSDLNIGIYYVQFSTENKYTTQKIQVK